MSGDNSELHKTMANPENDRAFKLHVMKTLDTINGNQATAKTDLKFFKLKMIALGTFKVIGIVVFELLTTPAIPACKQLIMIFLDFQVGW